MLAYDSDDPRPRSPGLERIDYKYEPPLSSSTSGRRRKSMNNLRNSTHPESSDGSRRKRSRRHKPSQGDVVLWTTSYPNRPDIAKETGQRALLSNSEDDNTSRDPASDEDEDEDMSEDSQPQGPADNLGLSRQTLGQQHNRSSEDSQASSGQTESQRLRGRRASGTRQSPPEPRQVASSRDTQFAIGQDRSHYPYEGQSRDLDAEAGHGGGGQSSQVRSENAIPKEKGPWVPGSMYKPPQPKELRSQSLQDSSSITMSPALRPHMISASGFSTRTLAAYQTDSPTTSTVPGAFTGPEQSLPPVSRLFHVADNPADYQTSSTRPRTDSISSHQSSVRSAPTPSGPYFPRNPQLSLASPISHLDRSQTDPVSNPPPLSGIAPISSYTFPQVSPSRINESRPEVPKSPFSSSGMSAQSQPSSARAGRKPSNPTGPRLPVKRRRSIRALEDSGASSSTQGPSAEYRCTYPDCKASPFQTQYLLNSHKNVHSDDRPHFCPDKSCPRSEGGLGFKRKNEMLRHGLVHSSPGYHCPFCPDKEHRYPRPDNLQRHVRQHHEDIDPNDPRFREILDQPRIGGTAAAQRGRRRRTIDSQRDEPN